MRLGQVLGLLSERIGHSLFGRFLGIALDLAELGGTSCSHHTPQRAGPGPALAVRMVHPIGSDRIGAG